MDPLQVQMPPCAAASEGELAWPNQVSVTSERRERLGTLAKGLGRTKSLFSMESVGSSLSATSSESDCVEIENLPSAFGRDLRDALPDPLDPRFDGTTRKAMEPYLRAARMKREKSRRKDGLNLASHIATSMGVPYTALRAERAFLFDEHTYPLNASLTQALHVSDLSKIHVEAPDNVLSRLVDTGNRIGFQRDYDNFVTSFCIPLLHSFAISKKAFHSSSSDRIVYRYQAFPTIHISQPGGDAQEPKCYGSDGFSIGSLVFHIPLTSSTGASALYTESHPGREDWHPLSAKSFGLGHLFDGARCLHFNMENATDRTCVSIDFCVSIYRRGFTGDSDDGLCTRSMLADKFSEAGPGFYDEAEIHVGALATPGRDIVRKKSKTTLLAPDARNGYPFNA